MRKLTTLTALLSSLTSLVILVYLLVGVNISGAVTIDTHSICRTIAPEGSKLICVEQTSEFLDTEEVAYILIKLFEVTTADKISYKIFDPNSAVVAESSKVSDGNYPESYEIISLEIAGQNRPAGAYTFKFYLNDQEALSGTFTITQDTSTCEAQDFYCCPDSKICISASEGVCGSGKCCENEENCKSLTSVLFTRREVPSCEEEGLNGCEDAVLVYDYTLHGEITPEQKISIDYREVDVDCNSPVDVSIAYYDEETTSWVKKQTDVISIGGGLSRAYALLGYLGYVALLRSDECVPTLCDYGGYKTLPIGRYVNFGEAITFELCGITKGCVAVKDGSCNKQCTQGVDPDCGKCTNKKGDCCFVSYDGICDLDCAPQVDPDCCDKTKSLCCPGSLQRSGSSGCDKNCNVGDSACTGCTAAADNCCKPGSLDGLCDPDCPKLSNGVGYVDNNCCAIKGVPVTSSPGDCCSKSCDGICDPDCIVGLDPDCHGKGCCGDGLCDTYTNKGSVESCSDCPQDCGECNIPPVIYGW